MENKKHRITLTTEEINVLAHITRNFFDYVYGDDRPDHGMGILKQYREDNQKWMRENNFDVPKTGYLAAFVTAMCKLNRFYRKIRK